MTRYIFQRLAIAFITLVGVSLIVFLLLHLLPGDPARIIAGLLATDADVARIRAQLGLNDPLPLQYWHFLVNLLQGNLGLSARTSEPVLREILARLPATVELAVVSMALASTVGILAGVVAAVRPNTIWDYSLSALALFGVSMPVYWLGLMLIIVFAVQLQMLPAAGNDQPTSILLPAFTLAAFSVALIARMTRASMLDAMGQDYIRTGRAKGLRESRIITRHALKNAFIPILTVIGLQFGTLLGGAVLTESVFGWPGLGLLLLDSIFARDYPVVQGVVLVFATIFIILNLVTDLLYAYVDPRIHYA